MGAYISNQVKMHAYHLNFEILDNEFCKFHKRKFWRNPSSGRPTWNGQRLKLLLKIFHFWEFFNLDRPPIRIRPTEKSLCFFTFFDRAFKPSILIFRAPSSPHLLSSAPLSTWPSKVVRFLTLPLFWVRLQALTSFKRAFEPSLLVERAFEPSFLFERAFEPSHFLKRAFEPSLPFEPSTILLSAPSSPHFPFSFYLGRSPITMRPFIFYLGRSPITKRPFSLYLSKKKKKEKKKGGSSSKWLVSWFLHLSVKVVC